DNVRDHWARGVEDAALHSLLGVVFFEKELIEVDDRIFQRIAVAEVTDHRLHPSFVEQRHHVVYSKLVEVDTGPPCLASPPTHPEEGFHQLSQERIGTHVAGEVISRLLLRV